MVDQVDKPDESSEIQAEPGGGTGDEPKSGGRRARHSSVKLKGIRSIERLRDGVEVAAHELKRLREDNESLSRRIDEIESQAETNPRATALPIDGDLEVMKRKISGFIEAIDRYLERERNESQR